MSKTDVLKGSKVAASSDAELAEIEEGQEEDEASAQFDPAAAGLSNIPAAPPIVIRPEVIAIQAMQREMDSQPDADLVEMDEFIESHQFYAPDRERYGTSIPAEDFLPRTDPEVKMRPDVQAWQRSAIKHISAARDRAIKDNPEVDPLIFQSAWDSAYRRILDGSYRSGKMISANFANDAALDAQVDRGLAKEMRDAEVIAIVRAYDETTGKSVQVPITGTDLDKKLADRLPPSPQKTVLMAGINPTSWFTANQGTLDTELNRKYINEDGRTKTPAMMQRKIRDLYRPQANELGQEIPIPVISVPIFVDPTVDANIQGKNSINLDTVAENTKLSAKSEVTGGRSNAEVREDAMKAYREGSSILDVPRSVADTPEEYAEVVGRVVKDKVQSIVAEEIARIRAELAGQYVFSSNSDSLVDYLEGQTYGGIGEVPYARQVGALTLPVRAIEGKVTGPEGYEKDIADEGGLEFILGSLDKEQLAEAGITRAVDDLMRVAPTTVQAAPYWQAYKDWLLLNNGEDPKEGRKDYVLKRAGEIAQDPDQLALALATNYDPAGNMMVYAGRIFYPELHEISPVLAGLRGGAPRLFWMLIEPDALQGSFASLGGLGIAGSYIAGRVPRAARIMGRIADGAAKLDDAFAGAADAEDLLNRIDALKQSDGTGVFSWVAAQVADSGARTLNGRGAEDIADVVAAENRAYVAAAERVEKSKETLNKAMDGLADAKTAAEKKVSGVLAVDAQVVHKAAEVGEAVAEVRVGQRAIDATLKDDIVTGQAKVFSGLEGAPTAGKPLKGDADTFRGWAVGSLDPMADVATMARAAEGDAAAIKTLRNKTNKIAAEPPLRAPGVKRAQLLKAQAGRLEKLRKLLRNSDLSTDEQTVNRILEAATEEDADWSKIVDVLQANFKSADDQVRAATGALIEAENKLKIAERLSEVLAEGPPRSSLLTGTDDLLETMQETAGALRGAAETLATPEGQRLAKELFYQGGRGVEGIIEAEPERAAALLEIAADTSFPLAVLAGSGDSGRRIAMSFLALAESGEAQLRGYRQIWNSFSHMKNKYFTSGGKYGSLAEFFTDPLFITQQGLRLVADLVEMSGLATTRVGVLGGRFAARLQEIGNGTAREASAWLGDLGMIAKHFSGKAESGAPLAKAKAVEFVGTQNRIELGGPQKNVDINSNQLGGDLNQNILNIAVEGWAGVGRTFVKTKKGVDLTDHYVEKSESMFAFVASFVRETVDAGPAAKVGKATVTFGRWLNKPSKADETITNSQAILRTADPEERLRMLANGAIDSLRKNGVGKFTRGPIDDLPGAVLTVENKTFGLMLDNIVGGATEFEFAKRAANFAGPNVGIRNLRAMESRIGRPEAGAEGKSVLPRRETIEVGDRVVLRSEHFLDRDIGIDPVRRVLAGKPVEGAGWDKARPFEDVEGATRGPQFGLESAEATEVPLSLEVLKIEKKGKRTVATVMDVRGETSVHNLDDLSRFGAELSTLDLIDGYLVYGLNLMRDTGIPGKNRLDWLRPRDRYVRFVLHSYDEAGNPRIIPKVELGAWAKELANNAKKLDITLSGKMATNPLAGAIGQSFRGALSWWKQSVLFGISGLRSVAFFLTNAQGDFERMAIRVGYREAAQLSMYGTLGWVPMIGPMVQDVARSTTAAASKVTGKLPGVPEPTIFGSQYNAVLDDVLSGVNETRTYFNSRGEAFTINPREFMREARRAGVNEDYLRSESLRELRIAADQEFRGMIPALGASRKGATPAQLYRNWFDILRTTSAVATRRQKLMLYMHLRFNKGMDTSKATDAMNSSIFDYTLSTSPLEAAVLTQWSAFYTYKKNALLNDAVNFLSFDRQLARHLTNKMVFGTRYKRARALFHMETILRPRQDVAGKIVMDLPEAEPPLEGRPGIYKTPDYLTNVMLTQRGALSLDQQRRMIEEGSTPTAFSIGHGAPWAVAQNMNTFALMQKTIIGGLAAAFVGDLHFNSTQAKRDLTGAFLDTLFPTHQSILGSSVKQAFGVYVPRKKETRTLKESEVAFIRMSGLDGLMEKRGEKYVSSSPFVVNGLFDPLAWAGKETEYAGLLLTTIFGEMPLTPEEVKVKQQVYEPGFPLKIEELGIDFDKYKDTGPAGIRIAAADELAKVTYINMFNPTRDISWELQQAQYTHKRRKAAMQGRSDLAESDYKAEKKEESE